MAENAQRPVVPVAEKKSRTVIVACKIPNGLVLQLQRPVDRMEDTRNGPEPRRYNAFHGKRYFVHGPAYPVGTPPKGFPKQPMIEGGYAITRGIPTEFWETWLQQNKLAPYVAPPDGAAHGMIFAFPDIDDTASVAREQENLMSGMEPLSTDTDKDGRLTDPRVPKPISMSIAKIGHEPYPAGA